MKSENGMTAEDVISILGLVPLTEEGGLVKETYRSLAETSGGVMAGPSRQPVRAGVE